MCNLDDTTGSVGIVTKIFISQRWLLVTARLYWQIVRKNAIVFVLFNSERRPWYVLHSGGNYYHAVIVTVYSTVVAVAQEVREEQ